MFALADVNSFYASCEKVFRPDLKNKPLIVLSNNDGCCIARSREAKRLGIKMGEPWFKIRSQQFTEEMFVFSSNYELYASLSNRVMTCLEEKTARAERYSIDECFLDISGMESITSFEDFGKHLREHVYACTRLTIGVGMGMSKTLAKSAQWASKEWPAFRGVLALSPENPGRTAKLLTLQPVQEVWGVGSRIARKLNTMGITTALQLAQSNTAFIRKNFNVVLERTVRELNGESCISLEDAPPPKQQIVCSRSFGERITTYDDIRQAVCQYAERAAEKLRGERQYCKHISVFIKTSPFSATEPYYSNVAGEKLLTATQDTRDIIAAAVRVLERIWRDGHRYAKAGVMLNDFSGSGIAQLNLFDELPPRPHSQELMKVIDGINHSGLGQIWFAGRGIAPEWQMKREMLSPSYTTKWSDLPRASIR
ncbi:translesion error-prone DNA polymerase V subunit UmuC [Salmonella enterica subsp. enterica]|nr:translesion error-prone DNA polymerase V subunit UmuC [Salmonella enterica]ECC3312151.1 translesion error-prone DNA polymerase V subunit UmuC [Salmonella enterica subsp. enterica]EDR2819023.1 translesion error-prone DNA polymerase V subunit UmuC [Salmonella enterica subsp. enterica]EEJ9202736.1 translesion error-prone DNA polymerase V subunit UmuC [Salmonella enterica subsp. enterica serovar Newport]EJV0313820.1 translesion error-prone DNA polymerase V subunit UmuC [Salmonella enterica]